MLENEIENLASDLAEKKAKLDSMRASIAESKYDVSIQEATAKLKALDEEKDRMHDEQKVLNLQSETRASVDLKRKDVKAKGQEIRVMYVCFLLCLRYTDGEVLLFVRLQSNAAKFKNLTKKDKEPTAENMERDLSEAAQYVLFLLP